VRIVSVVPGNFRIRNRAYSYLVDADFTGTPPQPVLLIPPLPRWRPQEFGGIDLQHVCEPADDFEARVEASLPALFELKLNSPSDGY
jgi:hypothetical protein